MIISFITCLQIVRNYEDLMRYPNVATVSFFLQQSDVFVVYTALHYLARLISPVLCCDLYNKSNMSSKEDAIMCPLCQSRVSAAGGEDALQLHYLTSCSGYDKGTVRVVDYNTASVC